MPHAGHYSHLKDRISILRKALIPSFRSIEYSVEDIERTNGFILLCHAEIEFFFENEASSAIDRAEQIWTSDKSINRILDRLILRFGRVDEIYKKETNADVNLEREIKNCISKCRNKIKSNNGISSKDLHEFLSPIGLFPLKFDPALAASLRSFSEKRGRLAHRAYSMAVRTQIDPFDEADQIERIVLNLQLIAELFQSLD